MPPRRSIDGRLDIPEDLSVAFRVLCNAAKSDKARIQQLEVELARLSHRSEAAEAENVELQAQLKQLQGVQKQKDELSEQLKQVKEEFGQRDANISEQLSREAEEHEKELLRLQATLSQHKMDLVLAQHQLANLKQQRQHELQMIQQQYKTEVAQLQQDAAIARQQQQTDMQQQLERLQQQHQVEVLRLQQQLADALGKAKSAEASVKHIREVLSVHTRMGQQLSSLLMSSSTQDMQHINPLADRRMSSSAPVSPRDSKLKCESPVLLAHTQQLSQSWNSLLSKEKLTRRRSEASPVHCTAHYQSPGGSGGGAQTESKVSNSIRIPDEKVSSILQRLERGSSAVDAAVAAAVGKQQQQQQEGRQDKKQQSSLSTGATFKLLTKYSSLHRDTTTAKFTKATPAAAAAAAVPSPKDDLSVVSSATFLALPPNVPSLSQLAEAVTADADVKRAAKRASQATEATPQSAEQVNPLFSIQSTRPLVSGDYVPLGGHSAAAEAAARLDDKQLQPRLASGVTIMPFAQPTTSSHSQSQRQRQQQQQLRVAEQHPGAQAGALRRQQAGATRSILTQPAGRKQGEQQQTRLSKTTLHTAPVHLAILSPRKEGGPAVSTTDRRIHALVQIQKGGQQQQQQQEEQRRVLQHLGLDLAAQWVEQQGTYTQSAATSPRRPGKKLSTPQLPRTKYEQLLQQAHQQQQQQQEEEGRPKRKEEGGPGMMMYRWARRFSSGHREACAEDLDAHLTSTAP